MDFDVFGGEPDGDGDIRLVTIYEFEQGVGGATVALGVECEFGGRGMINPIILLMIAEHTEVGFNLLVLAFSFAITL